MAETKRRTSKGPEQPRVEIPRAEIDGARRMIRCELAGEPELEDVVQDALLKACQTWEPSRGAKFSTFAVDQAKWIAKSKVKARKRESPSEDVDDFEGKAAKQVWRSSVEPEKRPNTQTTDAVRVFMCHARAAVRGLLWPSPDGPE